MEIFKRVTEFDFMGKKTIGYMVILCRYLDRNHFDNRPWRLEVRY